MTLTFGKHKDEDIVDIPLDYLQWLEEQEWIRDDLRDELNFEIARRTGDRPGMGKPVKR